MINLEKLFTTICQPSPNSYSDSKEAAAIFIKNKSLLIVHIALILLNIILWPFLDLPSIDIKLRFGSPTAMLIIFVLCCRSYRLLYKGFNALMLNTVGIMMHFGENAVFLNIPVSYAIPLVAFFSTQNVGLTGLTSVIQLTTLLLKFKKNLVEAISFSDPDEFADNFSRYFILISIPLQILILLVAYDLTNKTGELSKATKRAEEALEQQKTFVYSFSHEMRNPMNSLLGNLELALMGNISSETREMIGTAKVCGLLLLNLINTVLDAGKLGLGKLEVHPVPTRVHDVFQKAWAISHDLITRKGLASHLKISRQVPARLLLDSHRLNQILMNLIGNAIKFTERGSITLAINWLAEADLSEECFKPIPHDEINEGVFEKNYNLYALKRRSRNEITNQSLILSGGVKEFSLEGVSLPTGESKGVLKIIIKDTGCGMTGEEISKLFQKFSQVGHVTAKRQIGTGLGLWISKEIVENMGGQIRAYSKLKVGSTFIICIPTTALPTQSQQQVLNIYEHLIPRLKSRKFTTIVADDSSFNVNLVCNFYAKIGVEVLATANNGQAAYDKYLEIVRNSRNIDVVTLDIDMPLMSGKEVCEKIRQYEKENNLKRSIVILISGNYEEEEMHNLLSRENENQADYFLKKPLVFEEFCYALSKYC